MSARASTSWIEMRTRSPAFNTVPSIIPSTWSSCAISRSGRWTPLYCIADVRDTTCNSPILTNVLISASVSPSAKYSCSGSRDRFSKGKTASERMHFAGWFSLPTKRYPRRGIVSMNWGFSGESLRASRSRLMALLRPCSKSTNVSEGQILVATRHG